MYLAEVYAAQMTIYNHPLPTVTLYIVVLVLICSTIDAGGSGICYN